MALLHRAELTPTKLELLQGWLPGRPWFQGEASAALTRVAAFRFDDPAGEVGIETMLVRAGDGPVLQVPLTYRDAPLAGAEAHLIGTTDHSVLGHRWVYDACGDPIYAAQLAHTIFTGGEQAEQVIEIDGKLETREPTMTVTGSGAEDAGAPAVGEVAEVVDEDPTTIVTEKLELVVLRHLGTTDRTSGPILAGTWPGQEIPLPLAYAAPR
ncbi:MAG: hypothetical protein ABW000_02220 [Actinoplanes sp.]